MTMTMTDFRTLVSTATQTDYATVTSVSVSTLVEPTTYVSTLLSTRVIDNVSQNWLHTFLILVLISSIFRLRLSLIL
jgi:hypothetical protein